MESEYIKSLNYPIDDLIKKLKGFKKEGHNTISFEVNDGGSGMKHATQIGTLYRGFGPVIKVNYCSLDQVSLY